MSQHQPNHCYSGEHQFWCILGNPLEKRVRLPDVYKEWCIGLTPKEVVLQTGNHASWTIKLKDEDGSVYLEEGWVPFRDYHMLRFYDALVFSHDDKVNFNVAILMVGGREHPVNRGSPYEFFGTDREADFELLLEARTVVSPTGSKRTLSDSEDTDYNPEANKSDGEPIACTQPRPCTQEGSPAMVFVKEEAGTSLPPEVNVQKVDRCRVIMPLNAVDHPYNVELPLDFARSNLKRGNSEKLLTYSGLRTWSVNCLFNGAEARINWGWRSFAGDYKVKEGQVVDFIQSPTHPKVINVNFPRMAADM